MLRKAVVVVVMSGLAACGSTDGNGNVASGPLGQQPLLTPEVQMAAQQGLEACVNALTYGAPLSALEAYGFTARRGGYQVQIDNPLIFAGDSAVSVRLNGSACSVAAGPNYPVEINTMQAIAAKAVAGRGANLDLRFRQTSQSIEVILE